MTLEDRRTEHLRLRRLDAGDIQALTEIHTDPRTTQHRPGGAPSAEEFEQQLSDFIAGWDVSDIGYWSVELGGQVIGCAGLRPLDVDGRPCWNLYYRFAPDVWGRGYATEVAHEAIKVAETELAPRPVVARTRPGNQAAINVALRAGLSRLPEADADGFIVLARGW